MPRPAIACLFLAACASAPPSAPIEVAVSASASTDSPSAARAVVLPAVADLFERPDDTSPVATQAVLGATVEVLARDGAHCRVRTGDGYDAWIPSGAIRALGTTETYASPFGAPPALEIVVPRANLYPSPSHTRAAPIATLAMGTRLERMEGQDAFHRVRLPDGRTAFVDPHDAKPLDLQRLLAGPDPDAMAALGRRLLETPYRWGGTTPFGFDCSGLMQFLFAHHGFTLPRDAWQQAADPRFETVEIDRFEPGDLLFFGDGGKVTHVALWIGDGNVLEATAKQRPCTKITPFDGALLRPRFLTARRLRPGAPARP